MPAAALAAVASFEVIFLGKYYKSFLRVIKILFFQTFKTFSLRHLPAKILHLEPQI